MSGRRTRTWNMRDVRVMMHKNGYKIVRRHGDHAIWKNESGNTIIMPDIVPNKMMMKRIIKENNLKEDK